MPFSQNIVHDKHFPNIIDQWLKFHVKYPSVWQKNKKGFIYAKLWDMFLTPDIHRIKYGSSCRWSAVTYWLYVKLTLCRSWVWISLANMDKWGGDKKIIKKCVDA